MNLTERIFQREGSLYIACKIGMLSSPLMQSEIIIFGLVKKYVKLSSFSYTIFILDLALNYIDKV